MGRKNPGQQRVASRNASAGLDAREDLAVFSTANPFFVRVRCLRVGGIFL